MHWTHFHSLFLLEFFLNIILQVLSEELDCAIADIVTLELNVCDTQPSCLGGMNNEFIFSGRLDNLASSFCALSLHFFAQF